MANNNSSNNENAARDAGQVKLTKLEQYVLDHPNTVIGELAEQLGTTSSAITKAYSRAKAKVAAAERESLKPIFTCGECGHQFNSSVAGACPNCTSHNWTYTVSAKPAPATFRSKPVFQWTQKDVAAAIAAGVYSDPNLYNWFVVASLVSHNNS